MKKLLFLCVAMVAFVAGVSAQYTYPRKWDIGGSMGVGFSGANSDAGLLSFESTFDHTIGETKWRWGVTFGLLMPAMMDYKIDETDTTDEFMNSGYIYLLGYADYVISAGEGSALYLHGGLAPCYQMDKWTLHSEQKWSAMAQLGIGMDFGFSRMAVTGYASIHGDKGIVLSYGLFLGKKAKKNDK